jgi:hypothetical protein
VQRNDTAREPEHAFLNLSASPQSSILNPQSREAAGSQPTTAFPVPITVQYP